MGWGPAVPALSSVSDFWGRETTAPHQGNDEKRERAPLQKQGMRFPAGLNVTKWGGD